MTTMIRSTKMTMIMDLKPTTTRHRATPPLSCCSDRTCLAATLLVAVLWFLAAFVTTPATVSDAADTDLALKYDTLSSLVRFSNALIWRSPSAGDTMHQAIGEPPDPMKLDALIVQEGLRRLRLG